MTTISSSAALPQLPQVDNDNNQCNDIKNNTQHDHNTDNNNMSDGSDNRSQQHQHNTPYQRLLYSIYNDLINQVIHSLVVQYHKQLKTSQWNNTNTNDNNNNKKTADKPIKCLHCQRSVAASKYAPHLEKCMGKGGRASSRRAVNKLDSSNSLNSSYVPVNSINNSRPSSSLSTKLLNNNNNSNINTTHQQQQQQSTSSNAADIVDSFFNDDYVNNNGTNGYNNNNNNTTTYDQTNKRIKLDDTIVIS